METMSSSSSPLWSGRVDGEGAEHRRWHQSVVVASPDSGATTAIVGFASDAGVARNQGRVGAAEAPSTLRSTLASLSFPGEVGDVEDAGDIVVAGDALEEGQAALGERVAGLLDDSRFVTVLGGGHETAFGSYLGLAGSKLLSGAVDEPAGSRPKRLGILNLDAHFDLRREDRPTSGTPFLQIAEAEVAAGREFHYAIVGISRPNNTRTLFDTADRLGVRYLLDEESQAEDLSRVVRFVDEFAELVDVLYLTVDLDVLPASVAPGVSAPAGFGVPYPVIRAAAIAAAETGKLALADVVELNPTFDVDGRTARSAARLIHDVVTRRV